MSATAPQVVKAAVLDEDETSVARVAVRLYLQKLRTTYRRDLSKGDKVHAQVRVERFDSALDLYERLGGDPDSVPDIEDRPKGGGS